MIIRYHEKFSMQQIFLFYFIEDSLYSQQYKQVEDHKKFHQIFIKTE